MKMIITKLKLIIIIALCLIFAVPFSACQKPQQNLTNGITVAPDAVVEYSPATISRAKRAVYDFLCILHQNVGNTVLSKDTENKYLLLAEDVVNIAKEENISEQEFLEYFDDLEKNDGIYAVAVANVKKGVATESDQDVLKKAFNKVTALWGSETVASVLYELSVYRYQSKNDEHMKTYETYKDKTEEIYVTLANLEKQNALKAEQDNNTLKTEIKKENFIPMVKLASFVLELFFGGGLDGAFTASLTNQEVVLILKGIDFSGIDVSPKGWELVLSLLEEVVGTSYQKELVRTAVKLGDVKLLAQKMQDVVELLLDVQKRIDDTQADRIRSGDKDGFISLAFNAFSDTDWEKFYGVTSIQINKDEYEKVATSHFGQEYTEYKNKLIVYTFEDLKWAKGGDGFSEKLEGYFAGICPAFIYGGR